MFGSNVLECLRLASLTKTQTQCIVLYGLYSLTCTVETCQKVFIYYIVLIFICNIYQILGENNLIMVQISNFLNQAAWNIIFKVNSIIIHLDILNVRQYQMCIYFWKKILIFYRSCFHPSMINLILHGSQFQSLFVT